MRLAPRLLLIFILALAAGLSIFPWESVGITLPGAIQAYVKPYKYGLDLHGGVELDYKVDLTAVKSQTGSSGVTEKSVVESLKKIIDNRVGSLGLSEPTIQTAKYGADENHIIVQIPVKEYGDISEEEKRIQNAEDIKRAKATIGKVVQIEFREEKNTVTDEDKKARQALAENALAEMKGTPFATVGAKYRDQYENVNFVTLTGALQKKIQIPGVETVALPYTSSVLYVPGDQTIGGSGETITAPGGYALVNITNRYDMPSIDASGATTQTKGYDYSVLYIAEQPSLWTPAKTADGKILNDKYLVRASVDSQNFLDISVNLLFNDEGKQIFGELTKRLVGKKLGIFVGGQLLTDPVVNTPILDGSARITGSYTIPSATELANSINAGVVPAPIYLTSERVIDAKIGAHALGQILFAGLIGLAVILALLIFFYRVSGLIAGIALVFYALLLVALIKALGLTLSLASIAGIILSIGLAIDANILIFERMREAIRDKVTLDKVISIGFAKSWTAIWDSHITSLISAIILFWTGVSLIKGFGLMLAIGIVLSLFTAMWVSRVLLIAVGRKMIQNPGLFIGIKK